MSLQTSSSNVTSSSTRAPGGRARVARRAAAGVALGGVLIGLMAPAAAGIQYCVGGTCVNSSSPNAAAQMAKIDKVLAQLADRKTRESALAESCERSGVWVYNPNPALVGYCLPTSPAANRVNRCNLIDRGVWIYGDFSPYPAFDLAMNPGKYGGLGGYCYQTTPHAAELACWNQGQTWVINGLNPATGVIEQGFCRSLGQPPSGGCWDCDDPEGDCTIVQDNCPPVQDPMACGAICDPDELAQWCVWNPQNRFCSGVYIATVLDY